MQFRTYADLKAFALKGYIGNNQIHK